MQWSIIQPQKGRKSFATMQIDPEVHSMKHLKQSTLFKQKVECDTQGLWGEGNGKPWRYRVSVMLDESSRDLLHNMHIANAVVLDT